MNREKLILITAILLASTPVMADANLTVRGPQSFRVAQGNACDQMVQNAITCYQRWKSAGGGTDGQAGSFYQCMQVYCAGASSIAGCRAPANVCN